MQYQTCERQRPHKNMISQAIAPNTHWQQYAQKHLSEQPSTVCNPSCCQPIEDPKNDHHTALPSNLMRKHSTHMSHPHQKHVHVWQRMQLRNANINFAIQMHTLEITSHSMHAQNKIGTATM